MVDFIIAIILLIILGAAIIYIVRSKKSGARCIGCPDSGSCSYMKATNDSISCNGRCTGCSGGCGTRKV